MQGFKNVKGGVLKMLSLWPETPCDALLRSAKKKRAARMGRPQMGMYILNQGLSKTGIICGCTV